MKSLKKLVCLILILCMAISICACGSKTEETPENTDGTQNPGSSGDGATDATNLKCVVPAEDGSEFKYDSITIGISTWGRFITGISPVESDPACSLVFDVVFKVDPITKEVGSNILEDWHFEDENTLVMKLKDNIYFSNGEKATAEDLLWSYYSHVDRGSAYITDYNIDYDNCQIIDELTLSMKFTKYYSAFFSAFSIYLYDKSWCESVGWDSTEWYSPVGSGPYTCTEYASDDHMTFVARDDYWDKENDPAVIRQWIFKYYPDTATMYMDLESGTIALCSPETTDYERWLKDGSDTIDVLNASSGVNYSVNFGFVENDVWYDKNVREAFCYGINWEEFSNVVLGVTYSPATSIVPADSKEYLNVGTYTYDLEKAKALLAEAGYDESNPLKLHTVMMDVPFYSICCEAFEYYCSQMNVEFTYDLKDVSATIMDWMTPGAGCDIGFYYDNLGSFDGQLVRSIDWAANPVGSTWTYIDDAKFCELYESTAYTTDEAEHIANSKATQQYLYDECLLIPFGELTYQVAYRNALFTENQIQSMALNKGYYNMTTLSVASAW